MLTSAVIPRSAKVNFVDFAAQGFCALPDGDGWMDGWMDGWIHFLFTSYT